MRNLRPLGARVHDATIRVLRAVIAAVATCGGPSSSPTRAPGGWVLGTGGLDRVHSVQHGSHIRRAWAGPRTHARGATACNGRSTPAPRGRNSPSSSKQPVNQAPAPAALLLRCGCPSSASRPTAPGQSKGRGGGGGGRGTAAEPHGVATTVYDLWAAHFATDSRALALRRWADSTVLAWARELRGVGCVGLLYVEQSRANALAGHLAHLAATGKSSAA